MTFEGPREPGSSPIDADRLEEGDVGARLRARAGGWISAVAVTTCVANGIVISLHALGVWVNPALESLEHPWTMACAMALLAGLGIEAGRHYGKTPVHPRVIAFALGLSAVLGLSLPAAWFQVAAPQITWVPILVTAVVCGGRWTFVSGLVVFGLLFARLGIVPSFQNAGVWLNTALLFWLVAVLQWLHDAGIREAYAVQSRLVESLRREVDSMRAKERAEAQTEAKSIFLAVMSHELRTPMNAIIGLSGLALKTRLDAQPRDYLEKIHRAGEGLLSIINDTLDFSKIESGNLELESIAFSADDVFEQVASLLGLKANEKGLELIFRIPPSLPAVLVGDPLRLSQVLLNLGSNASKFAARGEIVIAVEEVGRDGAEIELHFSVEDAGIGMTEAQLGALFQPFRQADRSTTRKYGGTGLGLAISKQLVERMGGRIWATSAVGEGSTFHFHARFGWSEGAPHPSDATLEGRRILVVERQPRMREELVSVLRAMSLEAEGVSRCDEATARVEDAARAGRPFDVVLLDSARAAGGGLDAVRGVSDAELPMRPRLVVTSRLGEENMDPTLVGMEAHAALTLPAPPGALRRVLTQALSAERPFAARPGEGRGGDARATRSLEGTRLLLVEDNFINQEIAVGVLTQAGVEVVVADNGAAAIDILSADRDFDGVLMDLQMPEMDGFEATRILRADPALSALPIVAMTATAARSDRDEALRAGMNDLISKPFVPRQLFSTIARWMPPREEDLVRRRAKDAPS